MPHATVQGNRVYYELHGPEQAPPLTLIMGMGGSCRGWLALQVPEFAKTRRTLIFDNRGVGETQDPGGPFTTADLADDTAELLDVLGIGRTDVLGVFMGGMIAQQLALRHAERVDRLVLAGTYARPDAKRRMLIEKWREMLKSGVSYEIQIFERLLWTLADETLEQTDLIEEMVQRHLTERKPVPADVFVRQCDACLSHDASDRLPELSHPTLVVCGQQDVLTPPALHRELVSRLPDAHLVTIPSAAHLVMAEAAQRFNQAVLQFLSEG